jgi:hypothetical protein
VTQAWERKNLCYICRTEQRIDPKKLTVVYALIPPTSGQESANPKKLKAIEHLCEEAIKSVNEGETAKQKQISELQDMKKSQIEVYSYIDLHIDKMISDLTDFKHKLIKELSDKQEAISQKCDQLESEYNFSASCIMQSVESIRAKSSNEKVSLEEVREQLSKNRVDAKELQTDTSDHKDSESLNKVCMDLMKYHKRICRTIESYNLDKIIIKPHIEEPTPSGPTAKEPQKTKGKRGKFKKFISSQAREIIDGIVNPFEDLFKLKRKQNKDK